MIKGYQKNSRMGRTLDYLASKGIDCIKIAGPRHRADKSIFLVLNTGDNENLTNRLYGVAGLTEDYMEIEVERMKGEEIVELHPKLKLQVGKYYNVLKIGYVLAEISATMSHKYDFSYLKPKF